MALIGFAKGPKTIAPSNYLQTVKCFPLLKSDYLMKKFDLNSLRDRIDEKYASLSEKLLTRDIYFTKAGSKRVLHLKPHEGTFEMSLESINSKGEATLIPLTEQQRTKATVSDIGDQLSNAEITSEEKTYDDTKLNNYKLSYKLVRKDVMELVFRDLDAKEKLYCYVKDEVGPVCICK